MSRFRDVFAVLCGVLIATSFATTGCTRGDRDPSVVSPESDALVASTIEPEPTSPQAAVQLLRWCWNRRDFERYRTIFADDYRAACAEAAGFDFHREDELEAAHTLFEQARAIRFDFAGRSLVALPDPRPGKTAPYHQVVNVRTRARVWTAHHGLEWIDEPVTFFLVRGDSALIPPDLEITGAPDPTRWYVERWEGRDAPIEPTPDPHRRLRRTTWCDLKYRARTGATAAASQ